MQQHGLAVSTVTVWRFCQRNQLSHKKGNIEFPEMDQSRAQEWMQQLTAQMGPHVLALDAAAFFFNHVRTYGWSRRGRRTIIKKRQYVESCTACCCASA